MGVSKLLVVLGFGLVMSACSDVPSEPSNLAAVDDGPALSIYGAVDPEGAIVLNKGSDFTGSCGFAGVITNELTALRNPSGRALLSCHWDSYTATPPARAEISKGWTCRLNFGGEVSFTQKTHFVLSPSGEANMSCHFDD